MSIFDSARFEISAAKLSGLPPERMPEIAFAGRSNAGKSTTINVLTRQTRLAFWSKTPGRTQLVNFFTLSRKRPEGGREQVGYLVDLPGYGFAKTQEAVRKSWSDLVGGYIAKRRSLAGLVVVMDARRPFMPTDEWLIEFMRARPEVKMHWLLNKSDQLKTMQKRETLRMAKKRAAEFGPNVTVQLFSGLKKMAPKNLPKSCAGGLRSAMQNRPHRSKCSERRPKQRTNIFLPSRNDPHYFLNKRGIRNADSWFLPVRAHAPHASRRFLPPSDA